MNRSIAIVFVGLLAVLFGSGASSSTDEAIFEIAKVNYYEEVLWPEEEKVEIYSVVIMSEEERRLSEETEFERINRFTVEVGELYSVEPELIQSIIWHESRYNPDNINSIGCMGLMQICTVWHQDRIERLGVTDLLDPYSNILVGVDMLASYISQGDIGLGLMLYSQTHNSAYALHAEGRLSWYATSVLNRVEMIKRGEV